MSRNQLANDIWRACDIMRRDNNCGGVMEYVEHLSWVLFLKFLDDQEKIFAGEAELEGRNHRHIIENTYRWSNWISKALGKRSGANGRRSTPEWDSERLMQFVRGELIPYLASLSSSPERKIIAGVFSERNVIVCASPYNLKDVLAIVDKIDFCNADDIHTVSYVYEDLLRKLGNENKMAGEFYTPRSVIRFMVEIIGPKIGETIYDPACGSCGFLAESYEYMHPQARTTSDYYTLQRRTFVGQEKKPIPVLIGLINMVLHGVFTPKIRRRNTLEENIRNTTERFDIIMTNPPFGGIENEQVQRNFPIKSNATELLFMEHIMKKLKRRDGARCGMVVPEGTLFREGAFAAVKKKLLQDFDLFMIVSLPPGTFSPYSDVKTALLFFERPGPTKEVMYCELQIPEGLKKFSKGSPIRDEHFAELHRVWKNWKAYRQNKGPKPELKEICWVEPVQNLIERGYNLSAKNPNRPEAERLPHPAELIASLLERNRKLQSILENLHALVGSGREF